MSSIISAVINGVNGLVAHKSAVTPPAIPRDSPMADAEAQLAATHIQTYEETTVETADGPRFSATISTDQLRTDHMDVDVDDGVGEAGPSGLVESDAESGAVRVVRVPRKPTQRASSLPVSLMPDVRTIGYVYDDAMLLHAPLNEHPEQPERILGIRDILDENACLDRMKRIPVRHVKKVEALLVHSEDHWDKVEAIARMTHQEIVDSERYYEHLSLYVCPETSNAAQLSCGGVIEASLAVARGQLKKTFAIVRPPGHHAEPEEHMGFCFFNNVAVACRVVQQMTPIKRILILDWDVHHGNGTQRAFLDDPSILYVSLHRYEAGRFYPGGPFGGITSCGEGDGLGYSVNIPWPCKAMGDADYLHAFQKIVMPIAMEFAPELVMISAGFDAAEGDDLGECLVTPAGYAHMTYMLSGLAGGKLVVALEGGYNVDSISNSSLAVARILLGEAPPEVPPMVASEYGTETVWQVAMQQSKYWRNVDPRACEPREEEADMALPIPEILKIHRQEVLYQSYGMLQIPLMDDELGERFEAQVLCSPDMLDKKTVVVFVHQFGNIRVELEGAMTCDMNVELSYLLDTSKVLLDWIHEQQYGLLEINTYPRPRRSAQTRDMEQLGQDLVTYLWDNYIQLAKAEKIVLVGHGPGCHAIMKLVAIRSYSVRKKVKAVVQVVGNNDVPLVPKGDEELRQWYYTNSFVAVPNNHSLVINGKIIKRHGMIKLFDEQRAIRLLSKALPSIKTFVGQSVDPEPLLVPQVVDGAPVASGSGSGSGSGKVDAVVDETTQKQADQTIIDVSGLVQPVEVQMLQQNI